MKFVACFGILLSFGVCYAYVYDVDPINPAKEYFLEKQVFDLNNDSSLSEFPDFGTWLDERDGVNQKITDKIVALAQYAKECYAKDAQNTADYYRGKTDASQEAASPPNCMQAERD